MVRTAHTELRATVPTVAMVLRVAMANRAMVGTAAMANRAMAGTAAMVSRAMELRAATASRATVPRAAMEATLPILMHSSQPLADSTGTMISFHSTEPRKIVLTWEDSAEKLEAFSTNTLSLLPLATL